VPNTIDTSDAPEAALLHQGMVPDHERLNEGLRALLLKMAVEIPDKGTNKSSGRESYFTNKWLSGRELHHLPDPEMRTLVARIETAANHVTWPEKPAGHRLKIQAMWAIVSKSGMEGEPHVHSGRVSGAYYVDGGDCNDTGNGAFAVYSSKGRLIRTITPQSGMMLMFPANMHHGVLRYESEQPRIVLSFNLVYAPTEGK
jgi:hypothetical protein